MANLSLLYQSRVISTTLNNWEHFVGAIIAECVGLNLMRILILVPGLLLL